MVPLILIHRVFLRFFCSENTCSFVRKTNTFLVNNWKNRLNTRKQGQLLLSKTTLSREKKYVIDLFLGVFTTNALSRYSPYYQLNFSELSLPRKQDKGKHFRGRFGRYASKQPNSCVPPVLPENIERITGSTCVGKTRLKVQDHIYVRKYRFKRKSTLKHFEEV